MGDTEFVAGSSAGRGRQGLAGALSTVAALAIVLLLVGSASGAPPVASPPGTATAPYKGLPIEILTTELIGCGKVSIPVAPVFNTTTGRSHQSVQISVASCLGTNGTAAIEMGAGIESLPITNMSTGPHNLTAHWSLSYMVHLTAKPGAANEFALAEYEVAIGAAIYDVTAGTNIGGSSQSFFVQHNITHGAYSHNVTDRAVTTWFNVSLNRTHVYQLELIVLGVELAEVGPGTSTATVSLNLGPGTNGTRLTSVRFA
jgi:hypothetical protein